MGLKDKMMKFSPIGYYFNKKVINTATTTTLISAAVSKQICCEPNHSQHIQNDPKVHLVFFSNAEFLGLPK